MYQEYLGQVMTFEQAYFVFEGYNFAMIDLEANERGEHYKGKVICISNDPLEISAAFAPFKNRTRALLQGKMDELEVPEISLKGDIRRAVYQNI